MSEPRSLVSSLVADAARAGVQLTSRQWERLAAYRDLLQSWNDRFNLTAIRDPEAVEQRLFLDALQMLPAIERRLGDQTAAPAVVDVGTGAGLPGLVLAIARPEWRLTLIEATGKKVRFLEQVIADLALTGVEPLHARAEDLAHDPAFRASFDVAVARAVASLPALLELCGPFLRLGGFACFPKSLAIDEELDVARRVAPLVGMKVEGDEILRDSSTRLVTASKVADTPSRYPRRPGVPAREPLHGAVPARVAARGGTR